MGDNLSDKSAVYALPAILDLGAAQALKDHLIEVSSSTDKVCVDGAAVERIATPAVQILLAAARDLLRAGQSFCLRDASQPVVQAFEDLGLAEDLKCWSS